jgi:hypothetical protein
MYPNSGFYVGVYIDDDSMYTVSKIEMDVYPREKGLVKFLVGSMPSPADARERLTGYMIGDPVYCNGQPRAIQFGINTVKVVDSGTANLAHMHENITISAAPPNVLEGPGNSDQNLPVSRRNISDSARPYVRWTFLYRKFGHYHRYIYLIVGVHVDVPPNPPNQTVTVETVFTELTEDGTDVLLAEGDEEYRPTLGMVFDAFFIRPGVDTVSSIGILTAVAILALIWAYYLIIFEED